MYNVSIVMINVDVYVYMYTYFIRTDDGMCVCMLYSRSNRNVTHHYRPICRVGKREGNKCVVREDDDDDIPRLCVSLTVFLFFSFSGSFVGEKTLHIALLKVHSSFSSDVCGKSKLPSLCTHAIIIIQCFVQRVNTSLDIYKFNYTTIHSDEHTHTASQHHEFLSPEKEKDRITNNTVYFVGK